MGENGIVRTTTSRHKCARRDERKQKNVQNWYVCLILKILESIAVNRSQGLKKEKTGAFKNLGFVAAQCNGIAACAYPLKIFIAHTLLYLTVWSVVLRPLLS